MKTCTKCHRTLPEDQFHWRNKAKGLRIARCRACAAEWAKDHYKRDPTMYKRKAATFNRAQKERAHVVVMAHLAEHPCIDCGESDPVVLEFDHVSGEKVMSVSDLAAGKYALSRLHEEMAKCVVRCANCHRRKTADQLGWRKTRPVSANG